MMSRLRGAKVLLALTSAWFVLWPSSSAQAQTEHVSIPPAAFTELIVTTLPTVKSVELRVFVGDIRSFDGSALCVGAPVRLPDGAQIQRLEVGFEDNDSSFDIGVELLRRRITTASTLDPQLMAALLTAGTPGIHSLSTTAISGGLVDNAQYVYYMRAQPCLRNLNAIRGAILEISVPSNLVFADDFETGDTTVWTTVFP